MGERLRKQVDKRLKEMLKRLRKRWKKMLNKKVLEDKGLKDSGNSNEPDKLPKLDVTTPLPEFGGNTGGLLYTSEKEEKYAISWTGKKEQIFEMPTGGSAIMQKGKNILYFSKKEQCLALGAQFRKLHKISDYQIFRIFKNC